MAVIVSSSYVVEYPESLAYAGNPLIVKVRKSTDGTKDIAGASITINVGDEYYVEERECYKNEAIFDISRYALMAFIDKKLEYEAGGCKVKISDLSQTVKVAVSLTYSDGTTTNALTTDIEALYGYITPSQVNGGNRKRKWFVNFPMTLDFYGEEGVSIYVNTYEGDDYFDVPTINGTSQLCADISRYQLPDGATIAFVRSEGNSVYLEGKNIRRYDNEYKLDIDRSTSGIYLRWLNHLGQWCYYLFQVRGRNYTTKETKSWQDGILRDALTPENYVYLQSGQMKPQYSQQESISLGAKLVDEEIYDFLLTITNSPLVDVLINAESYRNGDMPKWERVSVVPGSYARTNAHLQDFAVSINRNQQTTQML